MDFMYIFVIFSQVRHLLFTQHLQQYTPGCDACISKKYKK